MPKKSKKGTRYENELPKKFSLWWSEGKDPSIFIKTHGSGSRGTNRAKRGESTKWSAGDMTFEDPIGKPLIELFLMELKRGYSGKNGVSIMDMIDGKKKNVLLRQWIDKAKSEQKEAGRFSWMIAIRRDYKNSMVVIEYNGFIHLCGISGGMPDFVVVNRECVFVPLDQFFGLFNRQTFELLLKEIEEINARKTDH